MISVPSYLPNDHHEATAGTRLVVHRLLFREARGKLVVLRYLGRYLLLAEGYKPARKGKRKKGEKKEE